MERDPETGKYIESPDSLARKPLTVRLKKSMQAELTEVAKSEGRTESDIAREAIAQWLERRNQKLGDSKKP
ncbi:MAG: ribbon-helix-helix domain-containing protein [Aphanocapsa sp. GSE-SYN-MK-11-07L]|nr:ribbon-helix-helix domain-containing protein [Aphanocapsa sp. GSE-SYN-MK-11-07L]